jgi:hypothetical protein
MNTSDTPAMRMEQNNSGGFTAQTWDIGANEANWFVRDVTGGSRLPLRIRPGATTSSVDISATGNVGINTASPTAKLDVNGTALTRDALTVKAGAGNEVAKLTWLSTDDGQLNLRTANTVIVQLNTNSSSFLNGGNVGIGTSAPDQKLSVNGDADKTGGNTWLAFSD